MLKKVSKELHLSLKRRLFLSFHNNHKKARIKCDHVIFLCELKGLPIRVCQQSQNIIMMWGRPSKGEGDFLPKTTSKRAVNEKVT